MHRAVQRWRVTASDMENMGQSLLLDHHRLQDAVHQFAGALVVFGVFWRAASIKLKVTVM
ncbi:hypothetical protein XFLM_03335 [Xylella fastidiosa subsp. fastidiosa GB514]|nr:hypothetical protein XFLM_03335 [Xylella fastidiosa subsp. fastidiosa GB514]